MSDHIPTMFLFLEDKRRVLRQLNLLAEGSLDAMGIQGRTPSVTETYETLLNNGTFNLTAIIVYIDHPKLDEIMKLKDKHYKDVPVIFAYPKNAHDELIKKKAEYDVKYEIEKGEFNADRFKNLYQKISSDQSFIGKNNSDDNRYQQIRNLGKGETSVVDLLSIMLTCVMIARLRVRDWQGPWRNPGT